MTMRALICQQCAQPTGEFFDPAQGVPRPQACSDCQNLAPPPLAEPEEEEMPWHTCSDCGSYEFRYSETRTDYIDTRDMEVEEGGTLYFDPRDIEEQRAECVICGQVPSEWDIT